MTLESTIVILDNTEYARNGDHLPSRYEAQTSTIKRIFTEKSKQNQENTVGIMTMGGSQVEVLVTPSADDDIVLGSIFGVKLGGETAHFLNALQVAQLALKHRKNKNQRQRIIIFVASPIKEDEASLEKVAKNLKKNNISVDLINLCQSGENQVAKLKAFIDTVNQADSVSSFFLNVEGGITSLIESIQNTPIFLRYGEGQSARDAQIGAGGADVVNPMDQFAEYGGYNPEIDPEMAQVMKMSLEEARREDERRRLEIEKEQNNQSEQQQNNNTSSASANANQQSAATVTEPAATESSIVQPRQMEEEQAHLLARNDEEYDDDDMDEEALLEQAKLISMQNNPFEQKQKPEKEQKVCEQPSASSQQPKPDETQIQAELMEDQDFVQDLLSMVDKKSQENKKKDDEKK